jgi:Ca-activated chloride channel family protein
MRSWHRRRTLITIRVSIEKIFLVITDGQDNMSQQTLQETMHLLRGRNGPTLYAIGLTGSGLQSPGREALQNLADATAGAAFFPDNPVDELTHALAHDIGSQYTIAYKPQNEAPSSRYHPIRVEARAPGYGTLIGRTRNGYYTGESVR